MVACEWIASQAKAGVDRLEEERERRYNNGISANLGVISDKLLLRDYDV